MYLELFSIGCREVGGEGGRGGRGRGRGREREREGGEGGKEKDEEEGERKGIEEDSRYDGCNRIQMPQDRKSVV